MPKRHRTAARSDERESKLPAWAQDIIENLRTDLANARATAARLSGGPEDTNVILEPYDDEPVRLKKNQLVRFVLGPLDEQWIDVHPVIHYRHGTGEIVDQYAEVRAGARLVVRPSSTNVVHIITDTWR